MENRRLGSSGLLVSPICLGTTTFGSSVGRGDSVRLVHAALDIGINFIDTANVKENSKWLGAPDSSTFDTLEATEVVAEEASLSMVEYALARALARPAISSPIVGVKSVQKIEATLKGAEATLSPELLEKQDAIKAPPPSNPTPFGRS